MVAEIETSMTGAAAAAVQPPDPRSDGPGPTALQPRGDARARGRSLPRCVAVALALLTCAVPNLSRAENGSWDLWLAPYLWGLSMKGNLGVGHHQADVDVPFSDIVKDLDFGLMVFLDARKDRVGFFLNPIVSRVSSEETVHGLGVKATNDSAIVAAGAYYRLIETHWDAAASRRFILEPYVGARWNWLRAKIEVNRVGEAEDTVDWLDPIVGARVLFDLSPRWDLALAADYGGFGVGSDWAWNAQAFLGYHLKLGGHDAVLRVGYRALSQDYSTGSGDGRFVWDITQQGPVLGLAVRF